MKLAAIAVAVFAPLALAQQNPAPHPFFEGDRVHVVHLTFGQAGWYEILRQNFEGVLDPTYAAADFDWNGVHLGSIGVRFKGNSSYVDYPGTKKSFKLDLNEIVSGQELFGIDKLHLNNVFHDPSFVREKVFYELAASIGLAAPRTTFVALYVEDVYWGLYCAVEQVDEEFLASRFGAGEQGTLWKGDPSGTLQHQGGAATAYYDDYELETNEAANDWSPLIDLCARLALASDAELPAQLAPVLDADSALGYLALCSLTATLDGYLGRPHNLYYYRRDLDGRFAIVPWDANESFGARPMGNSVQELVQLAPTWTLPIPGIHPLTERMFANAEWAAAHRGVFRRLMDGAARPDRLVARMAELRDLVRPYVRGDYRKMYSNAQFEAAMTEDVDVGIVGPAPGLEPFVSARHAHLESLFGPTAPLPSLRLNELASSNAGLVVDEHGEAEPWLEIVNTGSSAIDLSGCELRTELAGERRFVFPSFELAPGARSLVWCDGETLEGAFHAPFAFTSAPQMVHLVWNDTVLDVVRSPGLATGESWSRIPDASGNFLRTPDPTPRLPNVLAAAPQVFVNEFLASNASGIADEASEREDWVELWNPNSFAVDLAGWHLSDDLANPTKWTFPDVQIAPRGYLLVWCDDEAGDGPLHATFKLSASGEAIGISASAAFGNVWVDQRSFTMQTTDVSEGRASDGAPTWSQFSSPTPLASNAGGAASWLTLPYGIGKLSSSSRLPALAWAGTPSASAADFRVRVVDARAGSLGTFFFGPTRAEVPFAGGTRWVGGPITRMGVQPIDANGGAERAIPIDAALVGATRCYQFWFRDAAQADGTFQGLSSALEVRFGL